MKRTGTDAPASPLLGLTTPGTEALDNRGGAMPGDPDGILDGLVIRSKYHATARQTVESAFDPQSGMYRYGRQVMEVPRDQYAECLKLFKVRISSGHVGGITNPSDAVQMVRQGSVSFHQARNIADSGRIPSLTYDPGNQVVAARYVLGLSFAIQYASLIWSGAGHGEALRVSAVGSMGASGKTFVAGVVTSQLLRLNAVGPGRNAGVHALSALHKTPLGRKIIDAIASASLHKGLGGAVAVSRVAKLLRTNLITSVVITGVGAGPDIYKAVIKKTMSGAQLAKNLAVGAGGASGGAIGWAAGAAAGASIGSVVPVIGTTIGGIAGGLLGASGVGWGAAMGVKKVADLLAPDDAVRMRGILSAVLVKLAGEFLLSENETLVLATAAREMATPQWLETMYAQGRSGEGDKGRAEYAHGRLEEICRGIVAEREIIALPGMDEILEGVLSTPDSAGDAGLRGARNGHSPGE